MRLVVQTEIPDDENLRRDWNALVERAHEPRVFYTYEWALAVQRAYASALRPLLFLGYRGENDLRGVAALATTPANQRVSFLCATTGDYCDFLSLPEERETFITAVLLELRKRNCGEIALTNLPRNSVSAPGLHQAAERSHYFHFVRTAYMCAQVSLKMLKRQGQGKIGLPRKRMVHRFLAAMGREGLVRLEHARSWDVVEPLLPTFTKTHVARFLSTGRLSNMISSERRMFLGELARQLSKTHWLALTRLQVGEKTAAWHYGFQFAGTWCWYQLTFDGAMGKYSPGFCLLSKMIEEAADNPVFHTVDLGLGTEEYKEQLANGKRETVYVTLNASRLRHISQLLRHHTAAALKKQPLAERGTRSLLASYDKLKRRLRRGGILDTCRWAAKRLRNSIAGRDEVFFYDLTDPDPALPTMAGVCLRPLDLNALAMAAMQNETDEGTLAYLLRCARHLRIDQWEGFALVNDAGEFLHFAWAGPFDGFYCSEVAAVLNSPAPDSILLFDSWTPVSRRGKQYYSSTIALVAKRLLSEGKRSWIFSASTNLSSVGALRKAGLKRCFSVIRYRVLWWQRVVQEKLASN